MDFPISSKPVRESVSYTNLGIGNPPSEYLKLYYKDYKSEEVQEFFIKALRENNTEKAVQWLSMGANPHIFEPKSHTLYEPNPPIFIAIANENYEILDAMLKKSPLLAKYSQALHFACYKGNIKMVDYLISKGASLDFNGVNAPSTLRQAAVERVEYNSNRGLMYTPADVALNYNQFKVLKHLQTKYNKVPTLQGVSMKASDCVSNNDFTGLQALLEVYGSKSISSSYYTFNTFYGHADSVRWDNPFISACISGSKDMIKYFVALGVDVNYQMYDVCDLPLFYIVKRPGMEEIIDLFLKKGALTRCIDSKWRRDEHILDKALPQYKEMLLLKGIKR